MGLTPISQEKLAERQREVNPLAIDQAAYEKRQRKKDMNAQDFINGTGRYKDYWRTFISKGGKEFKIKEECIAKGTPGTDNCDCAETLNQE